MMPELRKLMRDMRQPLPPPAGIINGLASDPKAIVELSPEKAGELVEQDLREEEGEFAVASIEKPK
jgi:hypothetical protein